jgi:hypothetical protein
MVIGNSEEPSTYRSAQGVKSKALHFGSRLCANCNNVLTQSPDREFDYFLSATKMLMESKKDPKSIFEDPRYHKGSSSYLNVFRYFAKLLCCHIAEIQAPLPLHLSRFARGYANQNCVWLDIVEDFTYRHASAVVGQHQYAAHGGLVVYGDKQTSLPNAFHSTLTIGSICFVFFSRLNWFEKIEIRLTQEKFRNWCSERVNDAREQPLTESQLYRLGLAKEEIEDR